MRSEIAPARAPCRALGWWIPFHNCDTRTVICIDGWISFRRRPIVRDMVDARRKASFQMHQQR